VSYPPNPYGPPPQQPGQGPYGPPQQQPGQQYGQPYGYPQQPSPYGPGAGPGGYPGWGGQPGWPVGPPQMPGVVTAARVILFIMSGLSVIGGALALLSGIVMSSSSDDSDTSGLAAPAVAAGVAVIVIGALVMTLAVRYSRGRGGVRVTTIILGIVEILGGVLDMVSNTTVVGLLIGMVGLGFGIVFLVAMFSRAGTAWFSRPRY
jgi:hypothetical protein